MATLALCCATATPFGAKASLLGHTVTVSLESHFFGGFNNFPNDTAVVGPGVEFETVDHAVDPTYGWLYTSRIIMDFGADTILYKHTIEVPGTAGIGGQSWGTAYTAWVSNLNWNGTDVPLRFDVIHEHRVQLVSAGAQSAQILAPATHFWFGIWGPSYYEHSLLLGVSPVPEPSGALLAALGVTGLLLRRRLAAAAWWRGSPVTSRPSVPERCLGSVYPGAPLLRGHQPRRANTRIGSVTPPGNRRG